MNLLRKALFIEEHNYYSDLSVDDLKKGISDLLNKTKGFNFSVNLTGEFISENEFEITPKWQMIVIKGFEREVSFLNGIVFLNEQGRTQVRFRVRANSIFIIFSVVFPIVGFMLLYSYFTQQQQIPLLIVGLGLIFLIPAIMISVSRGVRKAIKNRFIETFNLSAY